ncbi:MAG: S49 family peptidase, partial [Sphingomonadales bacterium]|nr:S49 family peptidase [Sphingomonadales bacterium]
MARRAFSRSAIMSRLFNTPLAVTPDTATIVLGAIGARFDVAQLFVSSDGQRLSLGDMESLAADERARIEARSGTDRAAPHAAADRLMFVQNAVAHVDIRGELVAENGIGPMSGFTGYDGIRAQVLAADADPNVRGILLDIDCPGGEVADLYECVGVLMGRRGTKPMRAIIRGLGASAAYAIAACADEITINDLGYAGSVGTVMMHADFSQKLANDGVAVTMIAAGRHKTDGNMFEPLPEAVAARFEQLANSANDRFIRHVAVARNLGEQAVRDQQAQLYRGEEAVAAGLVDKVMSWSDSMDEFAAQVNAPGQSGAGGTTGRPARPAPGARTSQETNMEPITPEAHEAALVTARADERQRISALIDLDAESTVSEDLSAAIDAGTTAGDFAIALHKSQSAKASAALANAQADAVTAKQLPVGGKGAATPGQKVNRGEAMVASMRGVHPAL